MPDSAETNLSRQAEGFLRPPGGLPAPTFAHRALADRLDLLIELTATTNRLLAKLVDQRDRHPLDPPPVPPIAEILPVDPPSAKRARGGKPVGHVELRP